MILSLPAYIANALRNRHRNTVSLWETVIDGLPHPCSLIQFSRYCSGTKCRETLGVTDSNTIRISNWCTGKRPIPLDIVQENDADDFESMAEHFFRKYLSEYTKYFPRQKRNREIDMTDAQRFHTHFQHLKNLKRDSLIIIDNFNVLPKEEPVLKELLQYDFSILVTTRCKLTAFPVFELKDLDTEKELLPLFGNICPYENKETNKLNIFFVFICRKRHLCGIARHLQ